VLTLFINKLTHFNKRKSSKKKIYNNNIKELKIRLGQI